MPRIIGEQLTARDAQGQLKVKIATVFPHADTIVTLPGIHATQCAAWVKEVNLRLRDSNQPELSDEEEMAEIQRGVAIFNTEQGIQIRPEPSRMDRAFAADELLQGEARPKRSIKFLSLTDAQVRQALKRRGECWRMYLPPTAPEKIKQMIEQSRIAIKNGAIYYYSASSGTRYLTFDEFAKLGDLDDRRLEQQLEEIVTYAGRRNAQERQEVAFFMASGQLVGKLAAVPRGNVREAYCQMRGMFEQAVEEEYRKDDMDNAQWLGKLFKKLIDEKDDALVDDQSMGLDAEFSMRVEWQPGARIEEGELVLDPAMDERYGVNGEKRVSPMVRGLIFNLLQEYGDMEYINIGSVMASSKRDPARAGRREVYVAQLRRAGASEDVTQVIRMQKWGVRERLEQKKTLERAMMESEEYTEYVLDRLLGSRQLGMNLNHRLVARKVCEDYNGRDYRGPIWTPYFTRDYIPGSSTDRIASPRFLGDEAYAKAFAHLLGRAAAPNMIVGRAESTEDPEVAGLGLFDLGDEILMEDAAGMPGQIVVADHVGTFVDWKGTLESRIPEYAWPIRRRLASVTCRESFIDHYIEGFLERFTRVKEDYAKRRRAFDTMFKHRPWDPKGSLLCRWFHVLTRLREADPKKLAQGLREAITCANPPQ